MRIGIIGGLRFCNGGVERFTRLLSDGLHSHGFDIKLFEFPSATDMPPLAPLQFAYAAASFAGAGNFDIVHSHSFYAIAAAKFSKAYATTAHYSYLDYANAAGLKGIKNIGAKLIGFYERANFSSAKKIVAVSEYLKKGISEGYGIPPEKITVIRPGVALNRINSLLKKSSEWNENQNKNKSIFYIGRLFRQKNIETLIRAASLLKGIRLIIAGDGKEKTALQELAANLKVDAKFPGFVSEEDKYTYLANSDIVVFPSHYEAFPAVALEAMACGSAIIASGIPSYKEALDDCAVYFDKNSAEDLAGKIEMLLTDERKAKILRKKAKERSVGYDFSNVVEGYKKFYESEWK